MKTKPFNPVDYLENDSEIHDYLYEAFLDDDPKVFVIALGHLVKHYGVAKIATITGLNRESLYKTLKGDTNPTWETMQKLFKSLKIDISYKGGLMPEMA